jgi:NAD+ diphosphatase
VILGIIDEKNDSILLTRYAGREYKKYALVAGFVEMGESAEAAAKREAMEETGLEITDLEYFATQPWGFAQNLLIGYFAKVSGSREIKMDASELSEAVWVKREDVPAQPGGISLTGEMMWAFKSSQR